MKAISIFIFVLLYSHLISANIDTLEMIQTFREPKNIAFGALMGGASHINWVLSILDELTTRNHTAYFITRVIICVLNITEMFSSSIILKKTRMIKSNLVQTFPRLKLYLLLSPIYYLQKIIFLII